MTFIPSRDGVDGRAAPHVLGQWEDASGRELAPGAELPAQIEG